MASVANDGTLTKGSITLTLPVLGGGTAAYTLRNYNRDRAKPKVELDYDANAKPAASNIVEDFERITGTIRKRTDKAIPIKFTVFSYDGKNWQIIDLPEKGGTEELVEYDVEILEVINATVTIS